jgi:hypothetical protein
MICDLLSQAGISARIDGELLTGAGGELPLGNTVRVRVAPERAAEAREVIAEWEKLQPPADSAAPPPHRRRAGMLLTLLLGAVLGGGVIALVLGTPRTSDGIDYNGDGRSDMIFRYAGSRPVSTDIDRNFDGKVDARWIFDIRGRESRYEEDDDFDGRFEWQSDVEEGNIVRSVLDADGDGRPEQVRYYLHGVITQADFLFASGGRVVKRQHFKAGLLEFAEFDDDGDGKFERRVSYDGHEDPRL